jgi:hypothetical protein
MVVAVIVAAGAGTVALRFGSAGDWSLRTIGAVVVLAAALAILGMWARTLLAGFDHVGSQVVVVLVALVGVWGVGEPVVVAVAATDVPRPQLGHLTPGDRGLSFRKVRLSTVDGVHLAAWYVPSRNRAAVVALHGASSTRTGVLDQSVVLARHGYGVLLVDARGMGLSGGRAMNRGWFGDRDVAAAVDFLAAQPDVDAARIGALGESMGGEQAIGALAADPRLRAVVAEGATNRVAADLGWLSDVYGVRGRLQEALDGVTDALTGLLTDAPEPRTLRASVAVAAPRPVLLVVAGTVPDERHAADFIRSGSPRSVSIWEVLGARHTGGLRTDRRGWERRVVGFLDRALLRSG